MQADAGARRGTRRLVHPDCHLTARAGRWKNRVATRFEGGQHDGRWLDRAQPGPPRQVTGRRRDRGGNEWMVQLLAGPHESGPPPVSGTGDEAVPKGVRPMLEGKSGAVRNGAARPVDPDSAGPPGAGPHQRQEQAAVLACHKAGRPVVDQRDRVIGERFRAAVRLAHVHDGVVEVGDQFVQAVGGDDQDGQRAGVAQVGAGHPGLRPWPPGGDEHPAGGGQQGPARGVEQSGGERVLADHDAYVGQVGVGVEGAVPWPAGPGAGGGHSPLDERDQQRPRVLFGDHFGDADGVLVDLPGRVVQADPGGGGQPGPGVRGVVQRPQVFGGVGVGEAEGSADGREAHVRDGQGARQVEVESGAEQPVLPDRPVHVGTEVDPRGPLPEQHFPGDPKPVERHRADQPAAGGAVFGTYLGGLVGESASGAFGEQVPGPFPPVRMVGVFLLHDDLPAQSTVPQQLTAGPPVDDAGQRAAGGGLTAYLESIVLDREKSGRRRSGTPAADGTPGHRRGHPQHPVAQRRHLLGRNRQFDLRNAATGVPGDPLSDGGQPVAVVVDHCHVTRPGRRKGRSHRHDPTP